MIHFLVTADHPYTLSTFFEHWGGRLRQQVRIVHYESRSWRRVAPAGTWVFTDLERLSSAELADAEALYQKLAANPARWRLLNDPARVLRRRELLRALSDRGINSFRAFAAEDLPDSLRFPVFVRADNNHSGAVSTLLTDRPTLNRTLSQLRTTASADNLLVVEYCPYDRDDGLFVKRSVMRVGSVLIPRHMLFSRQWEVKTPDLLDDACVAEEAAYVADMPHARELIEIFDLAGIEYGRIDYTVVRDRIQVFEINTNPMLVPPVSELEPRRWPSQAQSAILMLNALEDLASGFPEPDAHEIPAMHRVARRQHWRYRVLRRFRRPRL